MNHLQLSLVPEPSYPAGFEPVAVLIDGVGLIDRLAPIEDEFAKKEGAPSIACSYAYLSSNTTLFPSMHFLGAPKKSLQDGEGRSAILICECGCEGCWDFVCRMDISDEFVTWSDFRQVHRDWSYDELGVLKFNRRQYEAEFRRTA